MSHVHSILHLAKQLRRVEQKTARKFARINGEHLNASQQLLQSVANGERVDRLEAGKLAHAIRDTGNQQGEATEDAFRVWTIGNRSELATLAREIDGLPMRADQPAG